MQVYAGLNQTTGELMAVKVLELVPRHAAHTSSAMAEQVKQRLAELTGVGAHPDC